MSARSEHLNEEAGLLVCYGKQYDEDDDDCFDCPLNSDCETLTGLRKSNRRGVKVAKIPAARAKKEEDEDDEDEDYDEELERGWNTTKPKKTTIPPQWAEPTKVAPGQYAHPLYMTPMPPVPMQPYVQPGLHNTGQIIPHPSPQLTYMVANPIDCPMPTAEEPWYMRIAKNVASGTLSEGGRQFYEFFRRFRF